MFHLWDMWWLHFLHHNKCKSPHHQHCRGHCTLFWWSMPPLQALCTYLEKKFQSIKKINKARQQKQICLLVSKLCPACHTKKCVVVSLVQMFHNDIISPDRLTKYYDIYESSKLLWLVIITWVSTIKHAPLTTTRTFGVRDNALILSPFDSPMLLFMFQPAEGAAFPPVPYITYCIGYIQFKHSRQVDQKLWAESSQSVALYLELCQWLEMIKASLFNDGDFIPRNRNALKIEKSKESSCLDDRYLIAPEGQRQVAKDSNRNGRDFIEVQINLQWLSRNVTWHLSEAPVHPAEHIGCVVVFILAVLLVGAGCFSTCQNHQECSWNKHKYVGYFSEWLVQNTLSNLNCCWNMLPRIMCWVIIMDIFLDSCSNHRTNKTRLPQ